MLLFALVAHEVAHGWTALQQGDDTAYKLGRITLNPLPHIDPMMTLLLPGLLWFASGGAFTFGGAKPVPVVTRNFRHYVRGDLIVSSAGVVTNLLLALLCTLLFILAGIVHGWIGGIGTSTVVTAQRMLNWGIFLNLLLGIFNLIPIPPLDGSRLLYHALPPAWGTRYRQLDRFGFLILLGVMFFFRGLLDLLLLPAWTAYGTLLNLAAPFAVGPNWHIFR
ncbi:MAG: site-2 protease family protein [Gemmatimonadales bacterium]